jgi:hypothetical protein
MTANLKLTFCFMAANLKLTFSFMAATNEPSELSSGVYSRVKLFGSAG